MSDNKNIDRLFQEKFKDYEVFPEPNVWKGIEKELLKKKKKRIIPLLMRLAGAAAILLFLIPVGNWMYNYNTKPALPETNTITDTDKIDAQLKEHQSKDNKATFDEENDKTNKEDATKMGLKNIYGQPKDKLITTTQHNNAKNTIDKNVKTDRGSVKSTKNDNTIGSTTFEQKPLKQGENEQQNKAKFQLKNLEQQEDIEETKIVVSETIKSDLMEEVEKQKSDNKIVDVNAKKWSIGSVVGPVYLNTSSQGSPIDPSLTNNAKSGNNSISYGLKVNYKITDKLSLQSGIQNIDLGYVTQNVSVIASSALLDNSKTNINSDVGATLQVSSTDYSQNFETSFNRSPFDTDGSLDQSFSYVEVPLEAKYAIVQKKLGVNIVGGFSTYFIYDNDVSITSFGKKTSLGEASNLNDLNFSGNIGLDVNYNLSPNLFINASPMLKYQLNTFSENSGGFKPYFFGVYTGLNFRF